MKKPLLGDFALFGENQQNRVPACFSNYGFQKPVFFKEKWKNTCDGHLNRDFWLVLAVGSLRPTYLGRSVAMAPKVSLLLAKVHFRSPDLRVMADA